MRLWPRASAWLVVASVASALPALGDEVMDDAETLDIADAACTWLQSNPPPRDLARPAYCDSNRAQSPSGVRESFGVFWYEWSKRLPHDTEATPRDRFDVWLSEQPKGVRVLAVEAEVATRRAAEKLRREQALAAATAAAEAEAEQRRAADAELEAQQKKTMIANAHKEEILTLCEQYQAHKYPELLAALRARNVFTAREISNITAETIYIGMREEAALCSWGRPEDINRTVLRNSVSKQLVYSGSYVYTENGVVTALQD